MIAKFSKRIGVPEPITHHSLPVQQVRTFIMMLGSSEKNSLLRFVQNFLREWPLVNVSLKTHLNTGCHLYGLKWFNNFLFWRYLHSQKFFRNRGLCTLLCSHVKRISYFDPCKMTDPRSNPEFIMWIVIYNRDCFGALYYLKMAPAILPSRVLGLLTSQPIDYYY